MAETHSVLFRGRKSINPDCVHLSGSFICINQIRICTNGFMIAIWHMLNVCVVLVVWGRLITVRCSNICNILSIYACVCVDAVITIQIECFAGYRKIVKNKITDKWEPLVHLAEYIVRRIIEFTFT